MYSPWSYKDTTGLPTWDERCLALVPTSVDVTQFDEDLRLTPTQRIEKLESLMAALETLSKTPR